MISLLYRTHKNLPASSKISSLYVFDSIARAARSRATKSRADASSTRGNTATFLAKLEVILDGLFQDMALTDAPGAKVSHLLQTLVARTCCSGVAMGFLASASRTRHFHGVDNWQTFDPETRTYSTSCRNAVLVKVPLDHSVDMDRCDESSLTLTAVLILSMYLRKECGFASPDLPLGVCRASSNARLGREARHTTSEVPTTHEHSSPLATTLLLPNSDLSLFHGMLY